MLSFRLVSREGIGVILKNGGEVSRLIRCLFPSSHLGYVSSEVSDPGVGDRKIVEYAPKTCIPPRLCKILLVTGSCAQRPSTKNANHSPAFSVFGLRCFFATVDGSEILQGHYFVQILRKSQLLIA